MVHWHGICWRSDKQPHHLLHEAIVDGLFEEQYAEMIPDTSTLSNRSEYKQFCISNCNDVVHIFYDGGPDYDWSETFSIQKGFAKSRVAN